MSDLRTGLLGQALFRSRKLFITVGVFSLFINLAMLNGPLFMLQVYDRVLTSGGILTLVYLSVVLFASLAVLAFLDGTRMRLWLAMSRRFMRSSRRRGDSPRSAMRADNWTRKRARRTSAATAASRTSGACETRKSSPTICSR